MAKLSLVKGTTSKILHIFIQDSSSTTGAGLTGLVFNSASLAAYYIRPGDASATAITLATATVGTWATGGFKEVSSANMPGLYEFDIPDACLATGANQVTVMLKGATNMAPVILEIELTAVNNQSATSFITGVNSLAPPTNWNLESIDSNGRVDVIKIAGTTQTARDIGASVLLSAGTGTGQLDFTSGIVKANAVQLLGTAWLTPGTAGTPDVNVKLWNGLTTVALPLVPTTAGRTLDVSAGGEAGIDWANIGSPTTAQNLSNTNVATVGSTTALGNGSITSSTFAASAIDGTAIATSGADKIGGAVWDITLASHLNVGSTGEALNAAGGAGDPWLTALPGAYGAGTAGHIIGTALPDIAPGVANGLFRAGSNAATSITTALTANIIGNVTGNLSGSVGSVTGAVGSVTGAVGSVTGNIGGNLAGTLSTTERNAIADALLNRDMAAVTVTNTRSPINGFRALRNRWSNAAGTYSVYAEDDTTVAWSGPVATDAAAIPVVGVDPS